MLLKRKEIVSIFLPIGLVGCKGIILLGILENGLLLQVCELCELFGRKFVFKKRT